MNKWVLRKQAKGLVHKLLARYGLAVGRLAAVRGPDLSESFSDPIQCACYSGITPYLTTLPINKGRTSRGVALPDDRRVAILKDFVGVQGQKGSVAELKDRLQGLKTTQTRENAADVFGLDSGALASYPHWAAVPPWSQQTPDERFKKYPEQVLRNRGESGMNIKGLSAEQIMSIDHTESHALQFFRLKDSIEQNGYRETVGFDEPTAVVFKKDDEWRWMIGPNGNHRIEVITSLGYSNVSARVTQLVDRSYAAFWPNVVRGYFTVEQAQCVFDGIFEGHGKRCKGSGS